MIFSESVQSGSSCVNCYHYYPLRREVLFNICLAAIQLTAYNENYEKQFIPYRLQHLLLIL